MPSALTQQTIRLTPEQQAAVQAAASARGVSLYRWLIQAVEEKLARESK